jgi:hypothetical protein
VVAALSATLKSASGVTLVTHPTSDSRSNEFLGTIRAMADPEIELRAGARLRSVVSGTEVIVVKPPSASVELRCGGAPMVPIADQSSVPALLVDDGETLAGKRYEHEETGLLVLCTKGGGGSLSVGDTPLPIQVTRALPSSD